MLISLNAFNSYSIKKDSQSIMATTIHDHRVNFYKDNEVLNKYLVNYVTDGLKKDEACAVIATPSTIISLNKSLRNLGIDVGSVISSGKYITYDAEQMLTNFMKHGIADFDKFINSVGKLVSATVSSGKPVRAFGEMVALLLKQGNLRGATELEQHWNRLQEKLAFSLYCAYPDSTINSFDNSEFVLSEICSQHSLSAHID